VKARRRKPSLFLNSIPPEPRVGDLVHDSWVCTTSVWVGDTWSDVVTGETRNPPYTPRLGPSPFEALYARYFEQQAAAMAVEIMRYARRKR